MSGDPVRAEGDDGRWTPFREPGGDLLDEDVEGLIRDATIGVAVEQRHLVEADGSSRANELGLARVAEGRVGHAIRRPGLAPSRHEQARGGSGGMRHGE